MKYGRFTYCLLALSAFLGSGSAQAPQSNETVVQLVSNQSSPSSQQPPTFRTSTRLVTIEVVARDHRGQPVHGLTAGDFQVFEQVAPKRDQRRQKIAAFQAVDIATIAAQDMGRQQLQPGVYTNLATLDKIPVPPTILLIDGINTASQSQVEVHRRMIKLLASMPSNMPVAVFLLGRELQMIQDFTTDPELLKAALQKAHSAESNAATRVEPVDDPNSLTSALNNSGTGETRVTTWQARGGVGPNGNAIGEADAKIYAFERESYASAVDTSVRGTLAALRVIARHVAGYPGRKNLLWISSSFPIALGPDMDAAISSDVDVRAQEFASMRNYTDEVNEVARALSDAKVAVYPLDPAGMETQAAFQADAAPAGDPNLGVQGKYSVGGQLEREEVSRVDRKTSMENLADQTGGTVCVQNNDLADCVKKAVNDGSSYYEIAYYPDSGKWDGKFHKIIVKSGKSGLSLAYRQGYYAQTQAANDQKSSDRKLQEAACNDLLYATSVLIVARQIPGDQPGKARFFMGIHPGTLTFMPQSDGSHKLTLKTGVCTFDKSGKPLQFIQQAIDFKLTEEQFAGVQAQHGVPESILLEPVPGVASVRLVVEDVETGRLGSVDLPYTEMAASASTAAGPSATSAPAQVQH